MYEIIGVLALITGLFWLFKISIKNKPLKYFRIKEKDISVYINNIGKYSIATLKGRFVTINEFKIKINQNFKSNSEIEISELKLRSKTFNKFHIGIEFLTFEIKEAGSYQIIMENSESIKVEEPQFFTKNLVKEQLNPKLIEFSIQKYHPIYKKLISLLLIVVGVIMVLIY